jgi:hypothetical protein
MKKEEEVIVSTVVEKLKVINSSVSPKKKKNIQNVTKK